MKQIAIIALIGLACIPTSFAALPIKVTKPSATVDENGIKVTKPSVDVTKPTLPEVKKPELPQVKKPTVDVTKPSATIDENGIKVVKPDVKLK